MLLHIYQSTENKNDTTVNQRQNIIQYSVRQSAGIIRLVLHFRADERMS